ncbi:MAG: hypothetical protein O7C61_08160 [SAR324 cluster bacterium]|nr:hypothetical protein [SAR324 cluster bacterium]
MARTGSMILAGLLLLGLFAGGERVFAQAPPLLEPDAAVPPPRPTEGVSFRFQFLMRDQYSYTAHPFSTLTGEGEFNRAATGSSGDLGTNASDRDANFFTKAVHALPPFGMEYIFPLPFTFPQGFGIGLDYFHLQQTGDRAAGGTQNPSSGLPKFVMDTYYIAVPIRFYGFDPKQTGMNFFVGASLGFLNGNLLTRASATQPQDEVEPFSESPVGAMRVGIETSSEAVGFRFELVFINAREVEFKTNPFDSTQKNLLVDMSGTIIRLSIFFRAD